MASTVKLALLVATFTVSVFFLWSRLDFSHYIYYFGDGDIIVDLIRLMVTTHEWDPNWARLVAVIHPQAELRPFIEMPKPGDHFYHMAGYMMIAGGLCRLLAALGFTEVPIQSVLHVFNLVIQIGIVCLLVLIGKKFGQRSLGIIAAALFAIFPLAVLEAHYERPESWLCLLTTALLYASLLFRTAPVRYSLWIGLWLGLSIATKFSQLLFGIVPGLLLLRLCFARGKTFSRQAVTCLICACLVLAVLVAALGINTPFILEHFYDTIAGVEHMASFYATAAYPYAEEQYHYFQQFYVSLRYFWFTLGTTWCAFFVAGLVALVARYRSATDQQKDFVLALCVPLVLFFFYSALQQNFIERNFSPWEGAICLISAAGILFVWRRCKPYLSVVVQVGLGSVAILAIAYTPVMIDIEVITRYFNDREHPPRLAFQEALKEDFSGFMIKNVYPDFKATGKPPEHKGKAPRLYQIDDMNEHWTRDALQKLETQGFRQVAIYCSEFSDMPPNSITIYHAAAKNHYYVHDDEWPKHVPLNYFKTNCP